MCGLRCRYEDYMGQCCIPDDKLFPRDAACVQAWMAYRGERPSVWRTVRLIALAVVVVLVMR